mgnify:CR=1 FL=1
MSPSSRGVRSWKAGQAAQNSVRQLRFPAEEFYSDRAVGTLSGGERIKLQLGRLLFQRPAVLLLDPLKPAAHGLHRVHLLFQEPPAAGVLTGDGVLVLGPNGAGKSTLLREIAAALLSRRDLKAAYMSQDYAETLPLEETPIDFLAPGGDAASG